MELAPIVLFVFNRPSHTRRTLESLQKNYLSDKSQLFIYSDGLPENDNNGNYAKITRVRKIIRSQQWCKSVNIIESPVNKGLSKSITEGVSGILNKYGKVIVLEDDMITSAFFLKFMNDALELYKQDIKVACISGYVYPVKENLPDSFFIKGAECWGWATWQRGWELYEKEGAKLLSELNEKNLTGEFDFDSSASYTKMLEDQIAGKNDSWAIRWSASVFLDNKLTLYPGKSFINNIGNDGSGMHPITTNAYNSKLSENSLELKKLKLEEDEIARKWFAVYFKSLRNSEPGSFHSAILRKTYRSMKKYLSDLRSGS